ncbi:MAG: multidrug ABC transporter substrate-binding protein [Comamonadaceae bacterium BICA1-1]|nr:MAG: multidrug ABC transporter substrate-binding protein [Comamonadaceae bacterium BICA1-1]
MNTLSLSWRYLWSRPLATVLNLLLLTLGVTAMAFVLSAREQITHSFERDLSGIDAVIGAKGSPIQLIMSGVFHLDVPPGNIRLADLETLRQHPQVARIIPLSLGDNLGGYRIVGTTPDYVALYGAELAQGQLWQQPMQAVLGAHVATSTGLGLGQRFVGVHGLDPRGKAHDLHPYTITGILAPCRCVLDRLVLTATESVWLVHDDLHGMAQMSPEERASIEAEREVTMALISYHSPLAAVTFPRFVNTQTNMQAAAPALELTRLLTLLGAGTQVLQGFGLTLLLMAALSIFVALWAAVRERETDLAMLRMLGTPARRLVALLLTEALALALLALLLGLLLAQALLAAMAGWLPAGSTTLLQAWRWSPVLLWVPFTALLLAALAAALPAWRVQRLDVMSLLNRN